MKQEALASELVDGSNRGENPFNPKETVYEGYSFRSKLAYFATGMYKQKVKLEDIKIISRLKGSDKDKVAMALESDVNVHCTCPDWKFGGFQFIGTQLGYATNPERRAPARNNPRQEGTVCKHLTYLLDNIGDHSKAIANDINVARSINYRTIRHQEMSNETATMIQDVRVGGDPVKVLESYFTEAWRIGQEKVMNRDNLRKLFKGAQKEKNMILNTDTNKSAGVHKAGDGSEYDVFVIKSKEKFSVTRTK